MAESVVESSEQVVVDLKAKKQIHVLHVDDELGLLKVAKQCLEMEGSFSVDTAQSVEEAMEKMKKESYDVVVSDYQMPGNNGLEFLKEIREKGNNIPFIMFTGKGREEVAISALNLGADQYLNKTGNPETVYGELAHAIRLAADRKSVQERITESEEKYRNLFENARDVIMTFDLEGNVTSTNRAIADYGYKKEELIGESMLKFISKEYWPTLHNDLEQLAQGKPVRNEIAVITSHGKRMAEYTSNPIVRHGDIIGIQTILRDVTDRKNAEESLRTCSEEYEKLFDSAVEGVIISGADGKISSANPAAAKILGYSSPKELMGMETAELYVDPEQRKVLFEQLMEKGYIQGFEAALKGKDDTEVCIQASITLRKDTEGNTLRTESVFREISEHGKIEQELRDLRERLNVLFEHAPDAYYMNDLRGTFVAGNKAAEEVTGYSKTELIGKSFLKLKLLPRSQILKAAKLLAMNALGKPTGPDEFTLNRKDGTQVQVEIRTFPAKIKGQTLVLGIARDVTERKKIDRIVLESRRKFEGLFTSNPEATVYLDSDFHILDINPRFTSLFGYSMREVIGKRLNDMVVPKDHIEEAETLDKKAVEGYVYHDTVRMRKDGSLIPVSISAAPIFIQGQLAGYIGVYKDISQLKKTEKDLQTAMERLETMNEKLRVVGGLARHDARNKLSVITGNVYLARKELTGNGKILDYLNEMEMSVQQVTRIFDFAKAYEMLGAEELVYVDVEKTVNEAISLFSGPKDLEVINDCHGLIVLADSLLRQLFYNLIDNSLKYGEKITLIRIHYEKAEASLLKLVYEDDGVGISEDAKPKIFNEGFTTGKGSGYGLYLIKKMMEVYGWIIEETGEPRKGARFVMTIPKTNSSGKENYRVF